MIKTLSVALIHSTHSMEALSSLLFSLSGCKMPSSILLPYVPRLGNINKWTSLAFTHSPVFWVCAQQKTESHLWISQSLELRKPDCKIIFHPTSWRNHSGRSCGQLKHWYRSCFGISEDNFVMTLWGKNETLWATLHINTSHSISWEYLQVHLHTAGAHNCRTWAQVLAPPSTSLETMD